MSDAPGSGLTRFDPPAVAPPVGRYSHGVIVPPNARWLTVSGQVGVAPDGSLAADFAEQARQAWRNVLAVVEGAGMRPEDLVKVTTFLTRPGDLAAYRAVRAETAAHVRPASTTVFVTSLVDPRWLIEIEAVAAAQP